jgi:tetratricopeptide (TPR) repeat protein
MSGVRVLWVVGVLSALPRPAAADTAFEEGKRALARKDYDRAIDRFGRSIAANPRQALAYSNRGVAYAAKGDHGRAVADFSQAIRLAPGLTAAHVHRGNAYAAQGEYARAVADYTKALALDPGLAAAYANRGNAHAGLKDYARAVADFTEALRLQPHDPVTHHNRANARAGRGEFAAAAADYREALRLDPVLVPALRQLAWLLAGCPDGRVRDGARARALAERACELSGWKDPDCLEALAAACAECGAFGPAVRWQAKALEAAGPDEVRAARARERSALYAQSRPYRSE